MSTLNEQITRLMQAKNSIRQSISNKGVNVPDDTILNDYSNLIDNIKTGTASADVTATKANVLVGTTTITSDSSDVIVEGTMPNNGAISQSLNAGGSYTIPAGYHNGSGKITANNLASQTSADATASQILSGYTAWVNGEKVTGNVAVSSLLSFNASPYSSSQITFTWQNPAKGAFSGVIIVGKTGSYPTSISDGTRWYKGYGSSYNASASSSTTISGFTYSTTYYFRAFSYATKNDTEWIGESLTTSATTPAKPKGTQTFTSSGTFTVPAGVTSIDIFCVGGGGGSSNGSFSQDSEGGYSQTVYGAGGGGYTATKKSYAVTPGQSFTVTVGTGVNGGSSTRGGTTSFGSVLSAGGGYGGGYASGYEDVSVHSRAEPGRGGSGGGRSGYTPGNGGSDGSTGGHGYYYKSGTYYDGGSGGSGQGTTTRAFGESSGTIYAGGGGGAGGESSSQGLGGSGGGGNGAYYQKSSNYRLAVAGSANSGGGGGACYAWPSVTTGAKGGSGICIVRWGY